MKRLTICNFGPIKEASIELKHLNVILGPQSSGKSTVLKVACFCDWMERQIALTQNPERYCNPGTITKNLLGFHKLDGFLHNDSYIGYKNDILSFAYDARQNKFDFHWNKSASRRWGFKRAKIAYIPSERNLVAAISNWYQVSMENNNILDFMTEWEFARKSFTKKEQILGLPFSYRYDPLTKGDRLVMSDGKELDLTNASSGLQSLTPLYVMLRYLTNEFYREKHTKVEETMLRENLTRVIERECPGKSPDMRTEIVDSILTPSHTDFYIEEPESHIFPSTQKDFVYSLVSMMNGRRKHFCFMSTHSPYILTSLNNLIQAGELKASSKEKAEGLKERFPARQLISFDEVAAFAMKDGEIESIMDPDFRLISADALDSASQEIADDFNFLLNI